MRLTFNRSKMQKAFAVAASVAASKNCPKPILSKVKLVVGPEGVTLYATDLEIGVSLEVDGCEVAGGKQGAMLLPPEYFSRILGECNDESMVLDSGDEAGDPIRVIGERSELKLPTMDPDEFPAVNTSTEGGECCQVPAGPFRQLISRTMFSCDEGSSRYALGGVFFDRDNDELIGAATDGRRLAVSSVLAPLSEASKRKPGSQTTIIPVKALKAIQRILPDTGDATFSVFDNHVIVAVYGVRVYSRLVEGKFPKWQDVLPKTDGCLVVEIPAGVLLSAVRQAAIVATQESRGMDFQFTDGELRLSHDTAEVGSSQVSLPIGGLDGLDGAEPVTVTLDNTFVSGFLKAVGSAPIAMYVRDKDSAVLFQFDSYRYVVMPLSRE